MRLMLLILVLVYSSWSGDLDLKVEAQTDYMNANYMDAAKKFSKYAASGDKTQKIDGLYWEAMSRFQAVDQGDELLSRADSTCQVLLTTAAPDDSLYFSGMMLSSYMALKKDPKLAQRRLEAASKKVPRTQKARYLWVGYLIYSKNGQLSKSQSFKSQLLKDFPDSPEASNVRNTVAEESPELKIKKVAPKRGQTVELKLKSSPQDEVASASQTPSTQVKIIPPSLDLEESTPSSNQVEVKLESQAEEVVSVEPAEVDAKEEFKLEKPKSTLDKKTELKAKKEAALVLKKQLAAQRVAEKAEQKQKAAEEKAFKLAEAKKKSEEAKVNAKLAKADAEAKKMEAQKAKVEAKKSKIEIKTKVDAKSSSQEKSTKSKELKSSKDAKLAKDKTPVKSNEQKTKEVAVKTKAVEVKGSGAYFVQLGTVKTKEGAETLLKQIQKKTGASGLKVVEHGGAYKVRAFGFNSKTDADQFASKKMKSKGVDALVVQQQNP